MSVSYFEVEQSVLGGLMMIADLKSDSAQKVFGMIKQGSFQDARHRIIFNVMTDLEAEGSSAELIIVSSRLKQIGRLDQIGGMSYLADIFQICPSAANIIPYADIVRQNAIKCTVNAKIQRALAEFNDLDGDSIYKKLGVLESVIGGLNERSDSGRETGLTHIKEIGKKWFTELQERRDDPGSHAGLSSGIESIDAVLGPKLFVKGSLLVVGGRPKQGKAQPLDSIVIMSDGSEIRMGDIKLGDRLASADGAESTVSGIFPQGLRKTYKLKTTDGREVICDGEHLWNIESSRFTGVKTVTTIDLMEMISKVRHTGRTRLSTHSGDFGIDKDIGMDPWLLGFLLGDGCLRTNLTFSTSEDYILKRVDKSIPDGHSVVKISKYNYRIKGVKNKNLILDAIRALDVRKLSINKSIPDIIFTCGKEIRRNVLAGLLESDGGQDRSTIFYTSSPRLRDGFIKLVRSLGGKATFSTKEKPKYTYKGEVRIGKEAYTVNFCVPELASFINSPRFKINRIKPVNPIIESITEHGHEECQCIMVTHKDQTYITNDYTVTHNTSFLEQMCISSAANKDKITAIFSLEMPDLQLYERFLSAESNVTGDAFHQVNLTDYQWQATSEAINKFNNSNIYIDDSPGITIKYLKKEVRALAKNKDIQLLAVDYLTLMKAEKAERNDLAYGDITKELKGLAKELNCVVLLLIQLNRNLEQRANKRPIPSDSRDTGQIEQDCDYWIGLYREAVYNDMIPPPQQGLTEALIRLNRHGGIGTGYMNMVKGHFVSHQEFHFQDHEQDKKQYKKF
jgi:replicative DNA helicase